MESYLNAAAGKRLVPMLVKIPIHADSVSDLKIKVDKDKPICNVRDEILFQAKSALREFYMCDIGPLTLTFLGENMVLLDEMQSTNKVRVVGATLCFQHFVSRLNELESEVKDLKSEVKDLKSKLELSEIRNTLAEVITAVYAKMVEILNHNDPHHEYIYFSDVSRRLKLLQIHKKRVEYDVLQRQVYEAFAAVLSLDPGQESTRQIYDMLLKFKRERNDDMHCLPEDVGQVLSDMQMFAVATIPDLQLRTIFMLGFQSAIPVAYTVES